MQHDLFHVYTVTSTSSWCCATCGALFHGRTCATIPVSAPTWPRAGTSPGFSYIAALFHGYRQRPWGRSLHIGAKESALLPSAWRRRGGHTAHRIPGQRAFDDEPGRAKADLSDPEVISAFAQRVRDRALSDRPLSAHRGETSVAPVPGLECVEGQLLEDLYPFHPPNPGWPRSRCCGQNGGPAKRQKLVRAAGPQRPSVRSPQSPVGTLDVKLFHAARGRRHSWHTRRTCRVTSAPPNLSCAPANRWQEKACKYWFTRRPA